MERKIQELIGYLIINLNNLKKSPSRQYLKKNLEAKKAFCLTTYNEAINLLSKPDIELVEFSEKRYPAKLGKHTKRIVPYHRHKTISLNTQNG